MFYTQLTYVEFLRQDAGLARYQWVCDCLRLSQIEHFLPRDAVLARYAMALCLSVFLGVCFCLSQVGVLLKRLNMIPHKQHRR